MYNPFAETVVAQVLSNIERSLEQCQRKVWLVYHNSVWGGVVESGHSFTKIGSYRPWNLIPYSIYSNYPS